MQTGAGEPVPVCRKGVFGLYIKDNFYGVFFAFQINSFLYIKCISQQKKISNLSFSMRSFSCSE